MKKLLLLSFLFGALYSCKQSATPKEAAQQFLRAVYSSDFTTASSLATNETKPLLEKANKEIKNSLSPEESFQFATFTETVSGNNAEVKNEIVSIALVKEDDGWKVAATETLLGVIQNREAMLASAKTKWEVLLKEYEGRLQTVKEYINYKKSLGPLSAKATALSDMANSFSAENNWTKEKILAYVQKQQQLSKVMDDALEPSLAANTDLSMTYFLQISNTSDRIKSAEGNYQTIAEQVHSPVYVPLPFKTGNAMMVKKN